MTDITTARPLLTPVELGGFRLPNRVVMAPVTRARAGDGLVPTELHAVYYGQRASAGLIVTEGTWVGERAVGFPNVPGVYSDEQVAAWRRVTDVVHALGGRIVVQLWFSGSAAPHEMSTADIRDVVADFATAAAQARRAGFDGVEVHAVGAFLLPRFLNARTNQRTDGYRGGRLLFEIVDEVGAVWGDGRVGVRISPYWDADEGFSADESTVVAYQEYVRRLGDRSLAYLHLRGPELTGPAPDFADFARYREVFDGPMIANLGFDRESGDAIVAAGVVDAVSYAKHYIANPDLVARFALGRDLSPGDPETYYQGGPEGYVDYPESRWS
ncbi:alkene reductase [Actinosynnema sp. NPDC047251]|uniref:Xenobiotic reductase B n=1 Tax=Saccharothrix espanaensis (strain ATCC 51144 / DSM 44229 / JCM 9112 / NBRC 15066 / NRRL 15764) TaxID=1179773 RepID=K0K0R9_SACES|nr:Xenobiotic reductase B [Saccharothrix espanaensis]CCH31112.1 Xenobiotic reductase B [Saccharothrix espanaensis DSM 44229]